MGAFFLKILCISLSLCNGSAEGLEGKSCELKALLTEGDTYKGDAKSYAKYEVDGSKHDTAKESKDEVKEGTSSLEYNCLTERLKNELCKLEVLLTEGDTYDSYAKCKAKNEVYCSENEAAEYAPKEIAEFFHCDELLEKI